MSKAFTKEDNEYIEPERPELALPGGKNYMTPTGFTMMKNELHHLVNNIRPQNAKVIHRATSVNDNLGHGELTYSKNSLREIDQRIRYLTNRLESAVVVDPKLQQGLSQVFFGATVEYTNEQDESQCVKIVGVDEADINAGKISWISPLAKTLLKAKVGDSLTLQIDDKKHTLIVTAISYS